MPFKIQEFRGKALDGAGARANLFEVSMTAPAAAAELNAVDEFKFACKAAAIPAMTVATIDVPYFGRTIKVPGNKTFDNWTVTIINDEGFNIRNGMEKWMAAMGSHEGNIATIGADFAGEGGSLYGQATVQHYSKGGGALTQAKYNFINIFPVSIAGIDLAWETNDAIEDFTVEFAYDYWTHTDVVT